MRNAGRAVDDLIQCEEAEIHRHDLDNRAHAGDRGANPGADIAALGQRCVTDAVLTQLLGKAFGDGVAAAITGDVLTHQEDAGIRQDGATDRCLAGVSVSHALRCSAAGVHSGTRSMVVKRSSSSTGSQVPASAKATAWSISAAMSASI